MIRQLDHGGQLEPLPLRPEVEIPMDNLSEGLRRQYPIEYARTGSRRDRDYMTGAVLCLLGAAVLFYVFLVR